MQPFLGENFLLKTPTAQALYHEVAKQQPIYDYHCHLDPKEIYEDKRYENITQIWLYGDHYKWRFMREMGVPEELVTGGASDYDKFLAYAKCVQFAAGNPLYHWTHLELQRYFGVYDVLTEASAPDIWERVNRKIQSGDFSARRLIQRSNVMLIGTTDDPASDLKYHLLLKEEKDFRTKVVPSFRPDNALNVEKPGFAGYMEKLSAAAGNPVQSFAQLQEALSARMDFFHSVGSRLSDHSLSFMPFIPAEDSEIERIFQKAISGNAVSREEEYQYKTKLMLWLGREYAKRGWVMQIHLEALRNNSTRMFEALGPDTGFDSIDDNAIAQGLSRFMDALDYQNQLPKTILYSVNPKDFYVMAGMAGNYSGCRGKVQLGSAWWFIDHIEGMTQQLKTLASVGALAPFVGMLTDSRSFLSYPRHEYFRRILCNLIGEWVENGEFTDDRNTLEQLVAEICCNNAVSYFDM